jgi:hypothetical protein
MMKIIISERQYKLLSEQFEDKSSLKDPSKTESYPRCVGSETSNKNRGELKRSKSGQYYIEIYIMGLSGFKFYNTGRVMYPDGKMGNYSCKGRDILVDGKNIALEKWQKEKGKYTTNWEKQELKKAETTLNNLDPHTLLMLAQIGTAFIPGVGPFLSAGLGLVEAKLYYDEGDKNAAGLTAALSILPFVGTVVSKIPGVKQFGSKGMASLASKISSGSKLVKTEIEIAEGIAKNAELIQSSLNNASQILTPLTGQITKLKPQYIARYGKEAYDNLLGQLLSGKADKNYFIQTLSSAKSANPSITNFVTKFGIKFGSDEVQQIQKIASKVLDDDLVKQVVLNSKTGPRTINVYTVPRDLVAKQLPASASSQMFADNAGNAVYIIKDNVGNLSLKNIEDLLTHEFAHIKDPSVVKSPKFIKKYSTEALEGLKNWSQANDLYNLGFQDKAQTLFNKGIKQYYLNPNEIIANNTMVLQNFSTNTKNLGNIMNKNQLIGALDGVINWSKGSAASWSDDVSKVLGYYDQTISNHFKYLSQNPVEYRKFISKLAQQAEYLKSQVKIAM